MKALLVTLALVAAACGDASSVVTPADTGSTTTVPEAPTTPDSAAPGGSSTAMTVGFGVSDFEQLPGQLPAVVSDWDTDWTRTTIDLSELLVGLFASDPRDLIRPIDDPRFETTAIAADWLDDREPGIIVEIDGEARFYPLSILTLHEIVNDELGEIPISVTYCPLCNAGVVFDRRFEGDVLRLGVSGLLRHSDLVMWDDASDSLWQQTIGYGIVGEHAGKKLTVLPAVLSSFGSFVADFPEGEVLSRDTGFGYRYGINPYELYSSRRAPYGFFQGDPDPRLEAMSRVVGIADDDEAIAFPYATLSGIGAANVPFGDQPIVVFWGAPDTADALDRREIAEARAIGTGAVYSRVVDGRTLTFRAAEGGGFEDAETGTTWSILGKATAGPLAGASLTPIVHRNDLWFAWAAFYPQTDVYEG